MGAGVSQAMGVRVGDGWVMRDKGRVLSSQGASALTPEGKKRRNKTKTCLYLQSIYLNT